jgi:deazaflavin-dependent oxidoreductase (nitroreductase family)
VKAGSRRNTADSGGVNTFVSNQQSQSPNDFEHQPQTPTDFKAFNEKVVVEFRANGGIVGGVLEGASLLLLTTTGARTGRKRLTPLAFFTLDDRMIIVGSYGGADFDPAWVHNLRADPRAHIELPGQSYNATAKELSRVERDLLYPRVVAAAPRFAEYAAATTRVIPLFELAHE